MHTILPYSETQGQGEAHLQVLPLPVEQVLKGNEAVDMLCVLGTDLINCLLVMRPAGPQTDQQSEEWASVY